MIPQPIERDCIIVESKKYCRDQEISKHEVAFMLLGLLLLFLWLSMWMYLQIVRDWNYGGCLFMAVGFPLLFIAVILLI